MRAAPPGIALALALLAAAPAAGQAPRPPRPAAPAPAAPTPPPVPEPPPPVYEPQLLKLAEIIGSLAFLRTLCEGGEARDWRARMAALLEAEGRTQARRERLTGAFNRGFRAYSATHRLCTPGSREATARLAGEGDKLAAALAGRFGG